MTQQDVGPALQAAQQELAEAIRNRDLWNTRILQLQQAVRTLSALTAQELTGNQIRVAVDMNDAILLALRSVGQPMTPIEIRDALLAMGFELRKTCFSNPMSALHNALRRLKQKGLAIEFTGGRWGVAA